MYDTVNVWVFCEDIVKTLLICHIEVEIFWFLATYELYSAQGFERGIVKIVGNNDFVASFKKSKGGERTNVPSSTAMCQ